MSKIKSILVGAGMITFCAFAAAPTMAQSSDTSLEDTLNTILEESEKCHGTALDVASLEVDGAIASCQMSVAGLVTIASAGGETFGLETLYQLADTAGTSAMMWAALEFKKTGGAVTTDVCQPVGMAMGLYDLLETSAAAKSKQDSGANMLAGVCRDAGISIN